jgi:NADH-quinone oxidoreductase subunit J
VDTPALLPDGSISELSISRVMRARGTVRQVVPTIISADDRGTPPAEIEPDATERFQGHHGTPIEGDEA